MEPFLGKTTLLLFCPSFTLEDWWLKSLWEKLQLDSQDQQLQKLWGEENNMVSPMNTEQLLGVFCKGLYRGYSSLYLPLPLLLVTRL